MTLKSCFTFEYAAYYVEEFEQKMKMMKKNLNEFKIKNILINNRDTKKARKR